MKEAFSGIGVEVVSVSTVVSKADVKALLNLIHFIFEKKQCDMQMHWFPFNFKHVNVISNSRTDSIQIILFYRVLPEKLSKNLGSAKTQGSYILPS